MNLTIQFSNMKFKLIAGLLIFSLFIFSCSDKKDESIADEPIENSDSIQYSEEPEIEKSALADVGTNSTFQQWLKYFRQNGADLSMVNFNLEKNRKLELMNGNIKAIFDSGFQEFYEPFLIYNPSKTMYLDIDSYHWTLDKEGMPLFEADQEINLVNLKEKTVNRVAFFGPSYWVDDAFWVSDSIFILLENNFDNQPDIQVFNLKENIISQYSYSDSTRRPIEPAYILERLESRGIISPN